MIRRLVARGLLSVVLAAALFSLFRLPAGAATAYQEITGMEELTSGQYVLVTPLGDAPGILLGEDFVISATKPTFTGDTDAAGAEWDLTVTANGVILTDAHGVSAAPMEGDRNGIAAGTYEWQVLWDGEYFSFHGCNGSEPVTLVSDTLREKDFLACRDVDIEEAPDSYVSIFTLYRRMEVQDGPEPEEPEKLEEPGEVVETSPSVTVLPEGGTIRAGEEITLTCEDESADIYYAVSADGVNYQPDALYAGPICFEKDFGTAYLRAYSIAGGCEPGEVTQVIFTEEFDLDWNLYFGQLHAHTDISNGAGSVEEAFQYASQVDGLDFFAVTDHSDSFDNADMGAIDADGVDISADWAAGKQAAASVTNGDFVGLFGFEMTWPEDKQLGHISTFNTPGWQTRDQADFENVPTALENYYKALAPSPVPSASSTIRTTFTGISSGSTTTVPNMTRQSPCWKWPGKTAWWTASIMIWRWTRAGTSRPPTTRITTTGSGATPAKHGLWYWRKA